MALFRALQGFILAAPKGKQPMIVHEGDIDYLDYDGTRQLFKPGDRVMAGRAHLFVQVDGSVEIATAVPGEKRSVKAPAKTKS